jgi:DNA-binding LacI/PurR family transcriptional regulator
MTAISTATLQEVADLAGVSRGTASRALSGQGRVSAETRERVRAAAASLDFSLNSGARNLRKARAGSIGLWLPPELRFMDYYMNFSFGVVEATSDRELTVSLIPSSFPAAKARSLHVDGFVMADVVAEDELARSILCSGRPVVTSELVPAGMPMPTASVAADHDAATSGLLDRLRSGGATSIVVLVPDIEQSWVRAVRESAAGWGRESGVTLALVTLGGVPHAGELRDLVGGILAEQPDLDAVLCVPDGLAVGVLSALQELGRSVPDGIQLVSYVDGATMPIVLPPIAALDLRPRDAGLRAGQLLVSLLDEASGDARVPCVELFELEFHERSSVRPL